jgi:hypothetical protein
VSNYKVKIHNVQEDLHLMLQQMNANKDKLKLQHKHAYHDTCSMLEYVNQLQCVSIRHPHHFSWVKNKGKLCTRYSSTKQGKKDIAS